MPAPPALMCAPDDREVCFHSPNNEKTMHSSGSQRGVRGGGRRGSGSVMGENLGPGPSPPALQCCQETLPFLFSKVGSLPTLTAFPNSLGAEGDQIMPFHLFLL